MSKLSRIARVLPLLLLGGWLLSPGIGSGSGGRVVQLTVANAIGPATDDYIERALESAAESNAELVVLRMDTPGGLDTAMRGIIKNISNSPVPVASYVAPTGARAASAGTYILYASHIAAMAPGTNLGAATPVSIGGAPAPEPAPDEPKSDEKEGEKKKPAPSNTDAKRSKAVNDAVAYIRGLAQLHGRNEEWAEKAVREAASLPAKDALEMNVIDIVANDVADLLKQINGREVQVLNEKRVLKTENLIIEELNPDWRSQFLAAITNPNVAYILMLIGIYGLIFEFSNPGAFVPGTVGAIALILALYSFQVLPINYAGVGLILLGLALMVGEAFQPSFGVLGLGGVVAFVFGSIILLDTDAPGFGINLSLIFSVAVVSALLFVFIIGMALRARRRPVVSGMEELVGATAVAADDFDHRGMVLVHSENWRAETDRPVKKGASLTVTDRKGLILKVEPRDTTEEEH